jgi:dimethylargininase
MPLIALTRAPSEALLNRALAFAPAPEPPIDIKKAREQHENYEVTLTCGCLEVERLPDEPDLPDAPFVGETALVVSELAIIASLPDPARQRETEAVATALAKYRPLHRLEPPATFEGSDALRIDRDVFIGLSTRTNQAAVDQIARLLEPHGYHVHPVTVSGCRHLKLGCSYVGRRTLLINRAWIDPAPFDGYELFDVPDEEPYGANMLRIRYGVTMMSGMNRTAGILVPRNFLVSMIDIGELAKAEAGMTSLSLIINTPDPAPAAP